MLRGTMEYERKKPKNTVSVLARSKKDLEKLEKRYPGVVHGIAVDYLDESALRLALKAAVEKHGRFSSAVVWMQDAPIAIAFCIAEFIGTPQEKGVFVHVRGSDAADPAAPKQSMETSFVAKTSIKYQEVILGFVREGTVSRWLDHEEITEGILQAIKKGDAKTIVGTVTPWAERPEKVGRP